MRAATDPVRMVPVWDRFVRVFHWSLVGLIAAAWLTEDLKRVHHWIGYTVLALVAARGSAVLIKGGHGGGDQGGETR